MVLRCFSLKTLCALVGAILTESVEVSNVVAKGLAGDLLIRYLCHLGVVVKL